MGLATCGWAWARWLFQHGGRYTLLHQSVPLGVDVVPLWGTLTALINQPSLTMTYSMQVLLTCAAVAAVILIPAAIAMVYGMWKFR